MEDELLSYEDVARMLCVNRNTLYSMVGRHEIPFTRIGKRLIRFPKQALLDWLDGRTHTPTPKTVAPQPTTAEASAPPERARPPAKAVRCIPPIRVKLPQRRPAPK